MSETAVIEAKRRATKWTPALRQVYNQYPASYRSEVWAGIVKAAAAGDINKAKGLARDHERTHRTIRAENVIARRIRLQRVALFALVRKGDDRIQETFGTMLDQIDLKLNSTELTIPRIKYLKTVVHREIVMVRRQLLKDATDHIWEAITMGIKNMGEAIKPILRDNKTQESMRETLDDIALIEGRLTLGVHSKLANRTDGTVDTGSDKWQSIMDKIYTAIAKDHLSGMTLSQRIWDLTDRAESDIVRQISTGIGQGKSARDIAKGIRDYTNGEGREMFASGPGIYSSPMKNAMRIARTEINRAYTQATASWAENKPWIEGIQPTLSPTHDGDDECDELAAGPALSPEEFAGAIPAHPHCLCTGTFVINEDYLTQAAPDEETNTEEVDTND
jgi:hypothetical protein